jgi:UDP-N-acetylglucosamine--N-acetylmuramyl-(pentapeptide) pyrophosphoryl-undecaprenol N-acetylglucosamine transferase
MIEEKNLGDRVKVFDFIYEMEKAYQAADIIVARSGALSISELCLVGKPVIFVPLPSAAEDHQTKNAMALVEKDAAILVKNSEVKEKLLDAVMQINKDDSLKVSLSKNIKILAVADATDRIINEIDKVLAA